MNPCCSSLSNLFLIDFSEGPDLWEAADYKRYLTQMAKLQLNFIGLHSYVELVNSMHALDCLR